MRPADRRSKILPQRAVIAITDRCNSKCAFCNIWQADKPIDLDIGLIDKLPMSLKSVDITGGEPLLCRNFELIIKKFEERRCRIIVNTNGTVDLKLFERLWKTRNLGVRFSLDGIGEMHDKLRGINGCYKSVIESIEYLKSIGFSDIGISSTFSDVNIGQALDLYNLSRSLKVDFTFVAAGNSQIYYKKFDNSIKDIRKFTHNIKEIIKNEIATFNLKRIGKAVYLAELCQFLVGNIKNIRCSAARQFFFMRPSGEIYACNMAQFFVGDLSKQSFGDIWFSAKAEDVRRKMHNCITPCWTMCNAKSLIADSKFKYLIRFIKVFFA